MRFWSFLLALALATSSADAQLLTTGAGSGASQYVGPGDITTFSDWWGDRAYTAAIARAGTTAAAEFERDSDSHTCDILVGPLGLTNTANCSSGGDNGTAVATWCAATTCRYAQWYDQAGGGNPQQNGTNGNRPIWSATAANGRACAVFNGSTSSLGNSGLISTANPYTQDVVYNTSLITTTAYEAIISGTFGNYMIYTHGAGFLDNDGAQANGSASRGFTSSDGNAHAVTFVANSASSAYNLDGVDTTFTTGGGALGGSMFLGTTTTSANNFNGCMGEAGYINSALSSGLRASLAANKRSWYSIPSAGVGSYTGPVDAVAGASFWYGLRGATQAYSNGSNHGVVIRRASDSALSGVPVLATGDLNVSAAVAFAGTDAVCIGAIATTTLTVASCSTGTLHVGDQIADANIANPTFITALGTGSGGIGTYTVNRSQTAASATFTATVAMFVEALPEQIGTGLTAQQTTTGSQPELLVNCLNTTKPCLYFNGASDSLAASPSGSQPTTWTALIERLGAFTTQQNAVSTATTTTAVGFSASANTAYGFSGAFLTATAADSAPHAIQFGASGVSSFVNVDGTVTSGSAGTNAYTGAYTLGSGAGANFVNGYEVENGVWSSLFNSTQYGAMHTNMSAYWGTP